MKKVIALLAALSVILALSACTAIDVSKDNSVDVIEVNGGAGVLDAKITCDNLTGTDDVINIYAKAPVGTFKEDFGITIGGDALAASSYIEGAYHIIDQLVVVDDNIGGDKNIIVVLKDGEGKIVVNKTCIQPGI